MHRVLAPQSGEIGPPHVILVDLGSLTSIASSGMLSASDIAAVSSGAVIGFPPVRMSQCWPSGRRTTSPSSASVTVIWQDRRELGCASAAKLNMLASCEPGAGADLAEPSVIDIDVAGGAGALATAIGVYAGDVVVDGAAHDRMPERDFNQVFAPAMFDIGNFRHSAAIPSFSRQPGSTVIMCRSKLKDNAADHI